MFRIITDGREFVVQEEVSFLWWTWWRDVITAQECRASFDSREGAKNWIKEHGNPRAWWVDPG